MTESKAIRAKLNEIDARIRDARERLQLKGLFDKGRKASADELSKRYQILSKELDEEVAELESHGMHVGSLEKAVLRWVNSLNFDQ